VRAQLPPEARLAGASQPITFPTSVSRRVNPWTPDTVLSKGTWVDSGPTIEEPKNGKQNGNGDEEKNGKKEEKAPEHIKDNSFLIEEAYNQEAGVVQHIFNWVPTWDKENNFRTRTFTFNYTMELPIGSQDHQFSFTLPFQTFAEGPVGQPSVEEGGVGDIFLNYRLQLIYEDECPGWPAVAPRFSLILPTGDRERGLGTGELGYQFNLPISKELGSHALHFNAGYTHIPGVSVPLGGGLDSPARDLRSYNLGGSLIWLVNYDFNLMLECVAYWNESLDDVGNRERSKIMILNPGFRWAVFTGEEVQWVLGVGVPIGLSRDAPDIGVFGYMSVEHNFKKTENGGE
jgi:hypothetical protein